MPRNVEASIVDPRAIKAAAYLMLLCMGAVAVIVVYGLAKVVGVV